MNKVKDLSEMPESIGGVSAEERETIVRKDYLDGLAHVCTTDYVEYGKLMRKCRQCPGVWRAVGYDVCCGRPQTGYFEAPAKLVRYGAPSKQREMTDGERAALSARMKEIVEAQRAARAKAKKGGPDGSVGGSD